MQFPIYDWIVSSLGTSALLGVVVYLFRETLAKFFTKSVEHQFDLKLEIIKDQLLAKSTELDHIMTFMSSQKRERDSVLQAKNLEAAEITLRACDALAPLKMAVEFVKTLNIEEIVKQKNNPDIAEFVGTLLASIKVDETLAEIKEIDMTIPRLYLNDRTLSFFNAHQSIIMHAILIMKLLSLGLDSEKLMKKKVLQKEIEGLIPISKESFAKYGESYAFLWVQFFSDEIKKALRVQVRGDEKDMEDSATITNLSIASQQAQHEVRQKIDSSGLPPELFNTEDDEPKFLRPE